MKNEVRIGEKVLAITPPALRFVPSHQKEKMDVLLGVVLNMLQWAKKMQSTGNGIDDYAAPNLLNQCRRT